MLELRLDHVTRKYGDKTAVDHMDYEFSGGVYGLLGANGAGKTTLLRMICNVLAPTGGEVLCNGEKVGLLGGEYRSMLGYLPQDFGYYPEFTAKRYLMYLASLKALPKTFAGERVEEMLELVGLSGEKNRKIRTFSGGMVRRLGIAQAMLNDPKILILDEPTSGLDPKERIRFRNIVSSMAKNRIVILSTHIVSDVEFIADNILMMKTGKLVEHGKLKDVLKTVEGKVWECNVPYERVEEYQARYSVSNLRNTQEGVSLRIISKEKPREDAINLAPNLEDGYLYYFEEHSE